MSEPLYRRLPGKRRGLIVRSSAWLAADHILLVEGSRVNETYQRVYLRDIQAMLIAKKRRIVIQTPVLLIPIALLIGVALLPSGWTATGWLAAGSVMAGLAVYLYLAGFLYGCRFYLATAVGNVRVRSVFRLGQAKRFGARVRPLIEDAQKASE